MSHVIDALLAISMRDYCSFYTNTASQIASATRSPSVHFYATAHGTPRFVLKGTSGDLPLPTTLATDPWACQRLRESSTAVSCCDISADISCPFLTRIREHNLDIVSVVCLSIRRGDASTHLRLDTTHHGSEPNNLGLLIACATSHDQARQIISFFSEIATLLPLLCENAIRTGERDCRARVIATTLPKRDLSSFLHGTLISAKALYPFHGASVFLWDDRRMLLRLRATTGLINPQPRSHVFYKKDEDRVTVTVAVSGKPSVTDEISRDHKQPGKYEERVQGPRVSFLAVPILDYGRLGSAATAEPLGVLRIINKVALDGDRSETVPFCWDDVLIFQFVAEILGVVTNYLRRATEAQDHFERVIHGLRANVEAIAMNLSFFDDRPDAIKVADNRMLYLIPDSRALVGDVCWQISRNVAWYQPRFDTSPQDPDTKPSSVLVYGEVLAPLMGSFHEMARAHNAGRVRWEYSDSDKFKKLLPVVGEASGLTTVFRNMIENALKYTDKSKSEGHVWLDCRSDGTSLEILVEDDGIGVPPDEEPWLFVDGFRCDNAMRRCPGGGSGIGLAHSRWIMHQYGGDVYYQRTEARTRFVVKMQLWKERL